MLKITDLIDTGNFVDLHDSEIESIRGGNCEYADQSYSPGSVIFQADGYYYECDGRFLRPDVWERV